MSGGGERERFLLRFGHVAEGSPWVAERAWERGPFADTDAVAGAFADVLEAASADEQLALIRAHPDLAGRAALAGDLTADSAREQASAGLDRLTADDLARFTRLNDAYRERFGFPFVMRVAGPRDGRDPRRLRAAPGQRRDRRARDRDRRDRLDHPAPRRGCGVSAIADLVVRGDRWDVAVEDGVVVAVGPQLPGRAAGDRRPGPSRAARRRRRARAPRRPGAGRLGGLRHRHARPGRGRGHLRRRHAPQRPAADARRRRPSTPRWTPHAAAPASTSRSGAGSCRATSAASTSWPSAAWSASRRSCAPAGSTSSPGRPRRARARHGARRRPRPAGGRPRRGPGGRSPRWRPRRSPAGRTTMRDWRESRPVGRRAGRGPDRPRPCQGDRLRGAPRAPLERRRGRAGRGRARRGRGRHLRDLPPLPGARRGRRGRARRGRQVRPPATIGRRAARSLGERGGGPGRPDRLGPLARAAGAEAGGRHVHGVGWCVGRADDAAARAHARAGRGRSPRAGAPSCSARRPRRAWGSPARAL